MLRILVGVPVVYRLGTIRISDSIDDSVKCVWLDCDSAMS
jgi:hypothetical protein